MRWLRVIIKYYNLYKYVKTNLVYAHYILDISLFLYKVGKYSYG